MAKATYVQITTACNMKCAHCCYNCQYTGDYMRMGTFKESDQWNKGLLNIGGGEPTLHPQLFEMIDYALKRGHRVWMCINGKKTSLALKLAELIPSLKEEKENDRDAKS